jgi:deazaflavin-dependent oxidoreductase (nitroreductase family)
VPRSGGFCKDGILDPPNSGTGAVWQGSEPNARLASRKERDTSRGSPRSFTSQNTLVQDDIKLHHYPNFGRREQVIPGCGKLSVEVNIMVKTTKSDLHERLESYRQIKLTVIGRKTGQEISNPVWFVFEDGKLYLLPVQGSDTQWYRNVLKNPAIKIDARGAESSFRAVPIKKAEAVKSVIDKFREKYGAGDMKKYYSKFDVAVLAEPA